MPTYLGHRRGQNGREPFHWTIEKIFESECPVSSITQKSFELVRIVNTLQGAKESTGSVVAADAMPGYLLDAARICYSAGKAAEVAMDEALNQ
jgi:hypothetical protein